MARLRRFSTDSDSIEFASSTDYYTPASSTPRLLRVLERFDAVMEVCCELREERAATLRRFCPFAPAPGWCCTCPIIEHDVKAEPSPTMTPTPKSASRFRSPAGMQLQWKPDWAMRWFALGVDYEMGQGSDRFGQAVGSLRGARRHAARGFITNCSSTTRQKISKSKGNGLTIDEWLPTPPESLSLFMIPEPKSAKRLYFDVIPRNVDDYQQFLRRFFAQDGRQQLQNPVWHILPDIRPRPTCRSRSSCC